MTANASGVLRSNRWIGGLLVLPAVLWLLCFAIAPMIYLACLSLWTSTAFGITSDWTLKNFETIFSEPVYLRALLRTLRIAALTTLFSLLAAFPIALFLSRARARSKAILVMLIFLPFWTSYVVRSFLWLPMLGRNGLINQGLMALGVTDAPVDWLLFNEGAIYIGLVYVYMLFMTLPIYQSLDRLDAKLIEAAGDLGATPLQVFRRVIIPLSLPGVSSGCTMVFLLSCGAYVTPQLLGGASGLMMGNVIATQFQNSNNWALGAALSIVLVAVVLLALAFAARRLGLMNIFMGAR